MQAVIFPGSFDPLTNGHLDIIHRASRIFERVVVAILNNSQKQALFSVPERVVLVQEAVKNLSNVEVDAFEGLLIDYAEHKQVYTILRGIRTFSDFEYEWQMAIINKKLKDKVETIFLGASDASSHLSSRLVREVVSLGGDVSSMVPPHIVSALNKHFKPKAGR